MTAGRVEDAGQTSKGMGMGWNLEQSGHMSLSRSVASPAPASRRSVRGPSKITVCVGTRPHARGFEPRPRRTPAVSQKFTSKRSEPRLI